MTSSRVLVTGATGQDGSYLLDRLLAGGDEVHALVRTEEEAEHLGARVGITAHVADLADLERLPTLVEDTEPERIYNLGGFSSVGASWSDPVAANLVSGVAVTALLEGVKRLSARLGSAPRFLQASTSEVFGNVAAPQTEETLIAPVNPYGAAKALGQFAVRNARAQNLFASSVILYNHESPRRPTSFVTRKITEGAARIALGLEFELRLGNLDARRDWGWAPDYVEAMTRVLDADTADDYIVATGISRTVREFVAAAFAAAGIDDWERFVVVDERFFRPVEAHETRGDATKIRDTLGWTPTVSFDELVAAMVEEDLRLQNA